MRTKTTHTPTPWRIINDDVNGKFDIRNSEQKYVCSVGWARNGSEDAAFIVRAVNAHEELLQAAKSMRQEISRRTKGVVATSWDKAIAKAEGK